MTQAVILAGGRGDRFWPLTSDRFPKYRLRFAGRRSILRLTHQRLAAVFGAKAIWVVTTRSHVRHVRAELPGLASARILVEPDRRNTAAAVYLSMKLLEKRFGPRETICFFPADHLIERQDRFAATARRAAKLASAKPLLVTIGIRPTYPAVGYGYIRRAAPVRGHAGAYTVERFVEKPDRRTAERYLKEGNYWWNAGMFAWRTDTFFKLADACCPEYGRLLDPERLTASYRRLPKAPIDKALMEKAAAAGGVAVVGTAMDWCDLGSWDSYYLRSPKDSFGNRIEGDVLAEDTRNCLLHNTSSAPLIVRGLEGQIVVRSDRGTLSCPRGLSEETARLSERLESR